MSKLRAPNEKVVNVFFQAIQLKWFASAEPKYGEGGRSYFMFDRLEIDRESYSWREPSNPEFLLIGYRVQHDVGNDSWDGERLSIRSTMITNLFECEIVYNHNTLEKLSHEKVKVMLKEGRKYGTLTH